jgi:hypothetical protein
MPAAVCGLKLILLEPALQLLPWLMLGVRDGAHTQTLGQREARQWVVR